MKFHSVVILMILCFSIESTISLSCDSCGSECARACGTRHFRTCCFNYVKKRSGSVHPYALNRLNYDFSYYHGSPSVKLAEGFNEGSKINSANKRDEFALETLYNDRSQDQQKSLSEDPLQKLDLDDM